MRAYRLDHLSDGELRRALSTALSQERVATAQVIACIAEIDSRRLHAPAGYASMVDYCVLELNLTEAAAYKRIQVARSARDFPALFAALADGRLNLTGVLLLGPHLTAGNVEELIDQAARRSKSEIEALLAGRFPRPDVPTRVQALPVPPASPNEELAPGRVGREAPLPMAPAPRPTVTPLAPERFALQVTIGRDTHDLLRQAQELLSHSLPSGDIEQVLHRALEHYVSHLEKRKFAATHAPRASRRRPTQNPRYIPAHVKRAVRQRDQGQCTFVGDTGHRCRARKFLQFDHEVPVARGGSATVENIRLRCSAHNQHEAERVYGNGFMHEKREAALQAKALRRSGPSAAEAGRRAGSSKVGASEAAERQDAEDLLAGLRGLGFRAAEARRAVEHCASNGGATLHERMRTALRFLAPRPRLAH